MSPEWTVLKPALDTACQRRCSAHMNLPASLSIFRAVMRVACRRSVRPSATATDAVSESTAAVIESTRVSIVVLLSLRSFVSRTKLGILPRSRATRVPHAK